MKVTVFNAEKLQKKINSLKNLSLKSGLQKAALRVERDAKLIVPVDTGLLRSSITTHVDSNSATIGTSIEYAAKVELGIGQRRQPYLTPAFNMNRDNIKKDIQEGFHNQLEKKVAK